MRSHAVCFEPLENESASSLLLRAASRLSPMPSIVIRHFLGDADAIASAVHRHENIDIIAASLGIQPDVIKRAMMQRRGDRLELGPFVVRIEDVDQTRLRICPAVLKNDAQNGRTLFQRLSWAIRILRRDPDTGEPIVDRCCCGNDLVWHRTERIEECPACGSLLWDSAVPAEAPEDTEAVDFLSLLFSASAARRRQARASLPWELELWSEGDLLELFEVLGLLSDPELLMRMPREGSEIWLRAVGIHAALAGIPSIRDLLALAFDDPPINADRFWSTRRMTLTNAAIQRSRSPQVRDFLTKQMRSLL